MIQCPLPLPLNQFGMPVTKFFFLMPFLLAPAVFAQTSVSANTYTVQSWWSAPAPAAYPLINSNDCVTFRINAPRASQVSLMFGEWNVKPQAMANNGQGVWTITVGPVEPDLYQYTFVVDGLRSVDLGNPAIKVGRGVDASVLDVPGTPPRFDQVQDVPHGSLDYLQYESTPLRRLRGLCVYVPPGYSAAGRRRYPVLYLRHGGGDNENSWSRDGRAGVILENLLQQHRAVPMLIVMTDGMVDGTWASGSNPKGMKQLAEELFKDVIPLVEKNYRIQSNARSRAIAGLSMGGGQAFVIGLNNPEAFSWVGEFSSGLLSDINFSLDQQVAGARSASALNQQFRLLWLACGKDDPRYPGHLNLDDLLKRRGINHEFHDLPGGHEWKVWRCQLHDFLEKLFKD
jgi:enterochelin esterase-like enzyme